MARCLAALELSLTLELAGGTGLKSDVADSLSLPRFFFSGMRSGALAKRATPVRKQRVQCSQLKQQFLANLFQYYELSKNNLPI